jgi:UDP-N-acetylglucosamine:LPS N-acetylglucosamine transferase
VAVIVGGAWGVGNLRGAAHTISSLPDCHAVVVTGHNERLRCQLARELACRPATLLGYIDDLRDLLSAADVVVQHAGGLTCLEAFAAGSPVIMFNSLAGHGRRNARSMQRAGLVTTAPTKRALRRLLTAQEYWASTAPNGTAAALALFTRPAAAAAITWLEQRPRRIRTPASYAWPLVRLTTTLAAALALATLLADPGSASWALAAPH